MFSHVVVGSNDLEKATRFYDAALGALGIREGRLDNNGKRPCYIYRSPTAALFVTEPINGEPATHANGGTIGFTCQSTDEVDRWHAAGTPPALPTAASRSRTRPVGAAPRWAATISPICATPMATSCAPCIVSQRDLNGSSNEACVRFDLLPEPRKSKQHHARTSVSMEAASAIPRSPSTGAARPACARGGAIACVSPAASSAMRAAAGMTRVTLPTPCPA